MTSSDDRVLEQTVHTICMDLKPIVKIKLFHFCLFLDKCLIVLTSFRQILDTFRRILSLDQLSISPERYFRQVVFFDQMSCSTKCLSTYCRGSTNFALSYMYV